MICNISKHWHWHKEHCSETDLQHSNPLLGNWNLIGWTYLNTNFWFQINSQGSITIFHGHYIPDRNVYFQAILKDDNVIYYHKFWPLYDCEAWLASELRWNFEPIIIYDNTNMKQREILGSKVCRFRSELVLSIVSSTCGR